LLIGLSCEPDKSLAFFQFSFIRINYKFILPVSPKHLEWFLLFKTSEHTFFNHFFLTLFWTPTCALMQLIRSFMRVYFLNVNFKKYFYCNESSLWPGQSLSFEINFITSWKRKLTSFYGRLLLDSEMRHVSLVIPLRSNITSSKRLLAEVPYWYLISFIACQTHCPS
jgi:hypothetical protein